MSVELNPANQLGFPRPLTQLVKRSLFIHNPHPHPVAFKVKTTAPKQYCVRPNSGRVESGESVEVQVLLQPLSVEPPPHAKCKDKFLVQSAFITPDQEMRTLAEMWTNVEQTNKGAIHEQKVKCAYLPPEDGTAANGIPEESEETVDQSRVDESRNTRHDGLARWTTKPDKEYDSNLFRNGGYSYWEPAAETYSPKAIFAAAPSSPTHQTHQNGTGGLATSTSATNGERSTSIPQASISPSHVTAQSTPAAAANTDSKPIPSLSSTDFEKANVASPTNVALEQSLGATTSDSDKLQAALKEIERLRSELEEARGPQATGLRRRGGAAGGAEVAVEKAKEVVSNVTSGSQGVPLEVVVGLVVGVFVMTYMFF